MRSPTKHRWWTVFTYIFLLLMCFWIGEPLAAEVHHVRGLVGNHTHIPCVLSLDRLSMIDHQSSYYDENLNRSYDSIRLILFYKDSIKSGPIYSIDNRNTQSSLRLAKHFASETFHSRLSIEDNLDPNSTASGHATRGKHPLKVKVELVGEQSLADSSIESGSKNGQSSNLVPSAGSPSTGIQLGPGFNVPLETPHHYHHYQQQLELEKQQQHSIDHNLDTIYLRIDGLKATDSGEYKCRVDRRRGRTLTTHTSLKVIVPPTEVHITNLDGDKVNTVSSSVDELSEARFVCLASSATPVPYFSWTLNNQPIPQHLSTSLSMLWQQQKQAKSSDTGAKSSDGGAQSIALTNHRQQIAKLNKSAGDRLDRADNDDQADQKKESRERKKPKNLKVKSSDNNSTRTQDDYRVANQQAIQSSTNTFATVNYISPAELTTTTGSVLLLRNLTRADIDSVLACSASHPLYPHPINGSIKLDINLKPASIELEKAKKALISGKMAQFKCSSWGSRPPAQITWHLDDKPLDGAKATICPNGNCTTSILNLQLAPEHDQQNLRCRARNTRFSQDFSLEAFTQLNVFYEPIVNLTVSSSMMTEGEELVLTCQAACKPSAISFSWLFNEKRINLQTKDEINNQGNSSTLRISSLSREHAGQYRCVARNLIGEKSSRPIDVQVNYAPRCKSNQKFVYGSDVEEKIRILCDVDSNPLPIRFHWSIQTNHSSVRHPLQQFHSSGSRSSALYTPTGRDQLGDVYCSAENAVGLQVNPCIFRIVSAGRPDSLDNCKLTSVESNEIRIGCDSAYDGGLSQVFHLEVYLKKRASVHKHQPAGGGEATSYFTPNSNNSISISSLSAVNNSSSPVSTSSVTSASRKSLYEEDVEHVLVQNLTNPVEPRFVARSLDPGNSYYFVLYSSNLKGRSRRPLELNARTSSQVVHNRNHTLGTFISVRASKPIRLVRENSDSSQTNRDNTNLIDQKNKHSMEFVGTMKKNSKNWIHHNEMASVPSTNDFDLETANQSKCRTAQPTLLNNNGAQLTVMLSDSEIMAQSTNATYNYLQQQISQLGQLSAQQQQLFLQQQPQLLEAKSPDLLEQLYRTNEFQLIESKKLMNSDPHNLLIISKGDQLDPDQSLKDAIISDPLLPLHPNLLGDQSGFATDSLSTGNSLELDVLSHHDLAKQAGAEFTYADTLKQLHLEPNCLLPTLQSALEENLANLMNSTGSTVNAVATLSRQQQFGVPNTLGSPCHPKAYITKSALDNRIIYSTISNLANAVNSPIELNNSITLNSAAIQQLTDNQSAGQLSTNNGSDLIEMSVNGPTTIYAMSMDDKSSEQLPFVSNV